MPFLLSKIGTTRPVEVALANPMSSKLTAARSRSGVIAAYIVELILAKGELRIEPNDFLLGSNPENYPYAVGMIMKSERAIEARELHAVMKVYEKWWESNHAKSLELLRAEWKRGQVSLKDSGYRWE